MRESLGQSTDVAGGFVFVERIWIARRTRERMGVGRGLLARRLCWSADRRPRLDNRRGLQSPGVAWRLVERQSGVRAFRISQLVPLRDSALHRRFPSCQDVELNPESLVPCLLRGSRRRQPPGDFSVVLEQVCTMSNSRLKSVRTVTTNICSSSRIRRLCRCRIVRPHVPRRASCTEAVLHRRVA